MDTARVDSVTPGTTDIVVVIGESYNKHHAGLYGYRKRTTPQLDRLRRKGELTVFDDVVTPWNLTSNAFKSFLSTHSADTPGTWADGVLFPLLFRRAGFKVAFVTNQFYKSLSQGSIDFNGSFFLNDPHLDSLCFDFRNTFRSRDDRSITQLLKDYTPGRRNLYLLHLWGQHMEYDRRYPAKFAFFQPDATTVRTWTPCNGRSLRTTTMPRATTTASWPTSCATSAAAMCSSSTLPTTARRSTTMG